MFVESNPMLEKLKRGGIVFGTELRSRSTAVVELIGLCGFDFVHIETEHYVCNDEAIEDAVRAALLTGTVPLLRIPTHDEGRILQVLDIGIQGLIVPHVDTPEQARAIIGASKYPPIGNRGASFNSRASGYGVNSTKEQYYETANRTVAIIPMIESMEGVNNIEAILDTNPDIIRIGRDDLSDSMKLSQNEPAFKRAVRRVIDCATERGIPVGTGTNSPEHARALVDEGYRMITYMSDLTILAATYQNIMKNLIDVIEEYAPREFCQKWKTKSKEGKQEQ